MKKLRTLLAMLSAAAMTIPTAGTTALAAEESGSSGVEQMVAEMTTQEKIEQMIMLSLRPWSDGSDATTSVTSLNDELTQFIQTHNFAGICLFADNIQTTEQSVKLTDEIQQAALSSRCGIPMLISADQEGGSIYRLGTGTPTCGNMALGAANDPALAFENAKIIGSEIKAVGINTDLAPVLDVNNNPSNPVINVRSFSSDPDIVSQMGTQYIKGLQSEGVITTCKHFPGHGDTATDSHVGLPLINKSYDEIKALELKPYTEEVLNSTDMIMTAHIQFPQIETGTYISTSSGEKVSLPATLSKTMITGILRNDLGYDGVVTTDSMMMDAIQKNFDNVDAAVLAINADVDIMLEPMYVQNSEDIAKMEKYVADIAKRVEDGEISAESIDKSVTRILTMKQNRGVLDYEAPSTENAMKIVGSAENREKALQIAEKGVTLVKNDDDILPLKLNDNSRVAYFYPYANVENTIHFALDRLKKDGLVPDTVTADCILLRNHDASEFEENIKNSDVVILAYEMYSAANLDKNNEARGWQAKFADDLIELAHANGKKVIFLSANIPYDVARFQSADAIVAAYCANGMDALPVDGQENPAYGVNYPAALITILGGNSPTGKLPVDVYGVNDKSEYTDEILYGTGYGLSYASAPEETDTTSDTTVTATAETNETTSETSNTTEITAAANNTATSTTSPAIQSGDNSDSPKTGDSGVAMPIAFIAAVSGAAFALRQRKH
ncbi:MAG: glycoside hydrolase family 3 protein [Ruminococcus sp.]|nr:glycoside hydrolase family 3 protein [Ruminococcus sp.]